MRVKIGKNLELQDTIKLLTKQNSGHLKSLQLGKQCSIRIKREASEKDCIGSGRSGGLPGWLSGKEPAYHAGNTEKWIWSGGRENPLEEKMATHFSIFCLHGQSFLAHLELQMDTTEHKHTWEVWAQGYRGWYFKAGSRLRLGNFVK